MSTELTRDDIAIALITTRVDWADDDDMELSGILGYQSLQKIADTVLTLIESRGDDATPNAN